MSQINLLAAGIARLDHCFDDRLSARYFAQDANPSILGRGEPVNGRFRCRILIRRHEIARDQIFQMRKN